MKRMHKFLKNVTILNTLRAIGKSFAELSIDRQGSAKALNLRKKATIPG